MVFLVAALACGWSAAAHARPHAHHDASVIRHEARHDAAATKKRVHRAKHRARREVKMDRRADDEIVLSPSLMRELQHHLADAGYFDGPADGVLSGRTRKALADFQHDYHEGGRGALTRASAEALLGRERVAAFSGDKKRSTL